MRLEGVVVHLAKEALHDRIDRLSEQEAQELLRLLEDIVALYENGSLGSKNTVHSGLKSVRFEPFQAIAVDGVPASQLLVAHRR